jgi:hypothetical protein
VGDSSGEGFAVRLYKAARPSGVIRALSDIPASFAADFNKVLLHFWRMELSGGLPCLLGDIKVGQPLISLVGAQAHP